MPALFEALSLIYAHIDQVDYDDTMALVWEHVQKETIDYGVMENEES